MSPLQLVLSGGAGLAPTDRCAKIFAEFDPPIVCGTYSKVSSARRDANRAAREAGQAPPLPNQQSEHFVLDSAMDGLTNYTRGTAFSYNVFDNQHEGTEHKRLTDRAASTAQAGSQNPTLGEQIDRARDRTEASLMEDSKKRAGETNGRSRVKDKKGRTTAQKKKLCKDAADCLADMAREHYKKRKIRLDTRTKPGMGKSGTPKATGRGMKGGAE